MIHPLSLVVFLADNTCKNRWFCTSSMRQIQSKWLLKTKYFQKCFPIENYVWKRRIFGCTSGVIPLDTYFSAQIFFPTSLGARAALAAFVQPVQCCPPRLALSSLVWQKPAHLLLQARSCNPACLSSPSLYKLWFVNILYDFESKPADYVHWNLNAHLILFILYIAIL